MRRVVLALLLVACKRHAPGPDASTVATMPSPVRSEAPIVDASIDAGVREAGVRTIDTPAWPAPPTKIAATWAVYPEVNGTRKVELVLRMGGIARRVELPRARAELSCSQLEPADVARITFSRGFGAGFHVEKHDDALDIYRWELVERPDGNGRYVALTESAFEARVPIPPGVDVTWRTVEISSPGNERVFGDCK